MSILQKHYKATIPHQSRANRISVSENGFAISPNIRLAKTIIVE
jgi:hypothetical protein